MTETVHADGTIFLCGRIVEMGTTLEGYFDRGYMIVPASSSAFTSDGKGTAFCSVYLPDDFRQRLENREQWLSDLSHREAARQKLLYARRKAAV